MIYYFKTEFSDRTLTVKATDRKDAYKKLKRWSNDQCETKGRELKNIEFNPVTKRLDFNFCGVTVTFFELLRDNKT